MKKFLTKLLLNCSLIFCADKNNEIIPACSYEDSVYQKYLDECKKKVQQTTAKLDANLEKIVEIYTCISFDEWQKNNKALCESANSGNLQLVKQLLESREVNANAKNESTDTALIIASRKGYKEIVELLLKNGADINAKNSWGDTALIVSSVKNHIEIFELLIEFGADIDARNLKKQTLG